MSEGDALADLDALRRGVVAAMGMAWDTGAHGGMTPTDEEIIKWVGEDHSKLLRIFEGHHERAGVTGPCPDCGMMARPKDPERCPSCGHRKHRDECLNMASDNDCNCSARSEE